MGSGVLARHLRPRSVLTQTFKMGLGIRAEAQFAFRREGCTIRAGLLRCVLDLSLGFIPGNQVLHFMTSLHEELGDDGPVTSRRVLSGLHYSRPAVGVPRHQVRQTLPRLLQEIVYLLAWRAERRAYRRAGALMAGAVAGLMGLFILLKLIGDIMPLPPPDGSPLWQPLVFRLVFSPLPLGALYLCARFFRQALRDGRK